MGCFGYAPVFTRPQLLSNKHINSLSKEILGKIMDAFGVVKALPSPREDWHSTEISSFSASPSFRKINNLSRTDGVGRFSAF